jgi:YD repeat-containing protein
VWTTIHRSNTATYRDDDADRMTSVRDPIGNLTQYGYNANGERTSMTARRIA